MNRWNSKLMKRCENKRVDKFIEDVLAVCAKHRMSIGHEDEHGSFTITQLDATWNSMLAIAIDETGNGR